jgi:hypothetical protein
MSQFWDFLCEKKMLFRPGPGAGVKILGGRGAAGRQGTELGRRNGVNGEEGGAWGP